MSSTAMDGVLEELRDIVQDESAELRETYQVWVLPERAWRLADARFAQQLHHQACASSRLTYVRSSMNVLGDPELDEIGNRPTAERIAVAASLLGSGEKRLLLVPSRQVVALWDPDQAKLVVALSATGPFAAGTLLDERFFEALLGQVPAEVVDEPRLRDQDTWQPAGRRVANEREVAVA